MKYLEVPPLSLRSSRMGWFASRRFLRWVLLLGAIFITLIALAYTVENWRGKGAWARYKHDTEARGLSLDWDACIPPPVPDDQNFFKAPNMQEWFTGRGMREISKRISFDNLWEGLLDHSATALVTIVPANARVAPESADLVLQYNPPLLSLAHQDHPASASATRQPAKPAPHVSVQDRALKALRKWIQPKVDAIGQPDPRPKLTDVIGLPVTVQTPPAIPPLQVVVRSDSVPSTQEIKEFFPTIPRGSYSPSSGIIADSSNTFRVSLATPPYIPAAHYIRWSDTLKDDFDAIREALKRPYARMEGDYAHPAAIPIPNFVCTRMVAQTLALRAQCYLLLGQPEKALNELTLLNDLSRLLEGRPFGKPMTLVAAMINVAVKGLYVGIIADGLRLHAWREPQLAALQTQLTQTDLLSYVHDAFQTETVSFGRMVEASNSKELAEGFYYGDAGRSVWQKLKDPSYVFVKFAPRGWLYQNAIKGGVLKQVVLDGFDLTNHLVLPRVVDKQGHEAETIFKRVSPYTFLTMKIVPNFSRAVQTAAKNQTLLNEALVVCALERYRLAHGQYPETLDVLTPRFADKLPTDLFGGGPLKYRNDGAKFLLYSIGWNEKDDGGVPSWNSDLTGDLTRNDWVWPYQEAAK